jgi:hypothetical protein
MNFGLLAVAHVGQSLSLDGCCQTATDKTYGEDFSHHIFIHYLYKDARNVDLS